MKATLLYKALLVAALIALVGAVTVAIVSGPEDTGPAVVLFFLLLGVASRGFDSLRGLTYSIMIFGGVAVALYYPSYLVEINGFKLSSLITPLIQIIMFGMGTSMSVNDFIGVIKMPKGVAIGIVGQFTIMPLLGFALANLSGFSPEIAAGVILIGCSPSGLASNVMSYLAKANLALSITLTTVTTLMAPLATPLLMKVFGGTFIEVDVLKMMWDILR